MRKVSSKLKKVKKAGGLPVAVVTLNGGVCLLLRVNKKTGSSLHLSWSTDGMNFSKDDREVSIYVSAKRKEKIKDCSDFSISSTPTGFVMTYIRVGKTKEKDVIVVSKSTDLMNWRVLSQLPKGDSTRATIVYDKTQSSFVLYRDGLFVKGQSTKSLALWKEKPSLLFAGRPGMFDYERVSVVASLPTKEGLLLIYDSSVKKDSKTLLQIGGVLFHANDPKRVIWRSEVPLWQGVAELKNERENISPVGFVHFNEIFMVYWTTKKGDLVLSTFPAIFKSADIYEYNILDRFEKNPIIEPRANHDWEVLGTFNPAVFEDEGKFHLFYRALGSDGISRIGYAQSKDGMHFTRRLNHPIFEPTHGMGYPDAKKVSGPVGFHPAYYTSGGGWGGSEDPRTVKIGDHIYMTYVAFEGWDSMRIAITSISVDDFRAGKWKWKKPKLISAPGTFSKNWVMFPEKIHGKFAILHSITPNISVDYIDNIDTFEGYIDSPRKYGTQPGRMDKWDNIMRGAGPPPLKTDLGWLLLYHAHDNREPHKYKLGAMILDKDNPTKILYRSEHPILSPDMYYENDGKPGVVYASGAVIKDKDLRIYYGGGDRVVCVATTPLKEFLDYMVSGSPGLYELKKITTVL